MAKAGPKTWREKAKAQLAVEYPPCKGYPDCDGDLEGISHEPGCPLFGKRNHVWPEIAIEERAARLAAEYMLKKIQLR